MKKLFISSFIRAFSMSSCLPRLSKRHGNLERDIMKIMKDMNKSYLKTSEENDHDKNIF